MLQRARREVLRKWTHQACIWEPQKGHSAADCVNLEDAPPESLANRNPSNSDGLGLVVGIIEHLLLWGDDPLPFGDCETSGKCEVAHGNTPIAHFCIVVSQHMSMG